VVAETRPVSGCIRQICLQTRQRVFVFELVLPIQVPVDDSGTPRHYVLHCRPVKRIVRDDDLSKPDRAVWAVADDNTDSERLLIQTYLAELDL